jgi:hypothetical protein
MRTEWPKRTNNLETIREHVEDFLKKRYFDVETLMVDGEGEKTAKIVAMPTVKTKVGERVRVEISETLRGIMVNFASTTKAEESIRLGLLSQLLVGGALVSRGLKVKEELEAFENEFWNDMQEFMADVHG